MQVECLPSEVRSVVKAERKKGAVVGVVPTMGALHAGHVSLIEAARHECDFVVTTIFVNPTQFAPNEDLQKYPRTLERDLEMCRNAGCDLVFTPEVSSMYLNDAETTVSVTELTQRLEGRTRPEHFQGVTTVVAKLFNITVPDRAYFGQKDFQQQLVIRRMVQDLDWGIEIVTCPIVRESDGLAMSSRNRYLSDDERQNALILFRALTYATDLAGQSAAPEKIESEITRMIHSVDGVELDYAVVVDATKLTPLIESSTVAVALVAAKVGNTRLIDNQLLDFPA